MVRVQEEVKVKFEEGLKDADEALEKVKVRRTMEIRSVLNE